MAASGFRIIVSPTTCSVSGARRIDASYNWRRLRVVGSGLLQGRSSRLRQTCSQRIEYQCCPRRCRVRVCLPVRAVDQYCNWPCQRKLRLGLEALTVFPTLLRASSRFLKALPAEFPDRLLLSGGHGTSSRWRPLRSKLECATVNTIAPALPVGDYTRQRTLS